MSSKPEASSFMLGKSDEDLTIKEIERYIAMIERDKDRTPPDFLLKHLGGIDNFNTIKTAVLAEVVRLKALYKTKTGDDYVGIGG